MNLYYQVRHRKNAFEIKTNKSSALGYLPPSVHRDNPNFHYENVGKNKIMLDDGLYALLKEQLKDYGWASDEIYNVEVLDTMSFKLKPIASEKGAFKLTCIVCGFCWSCHWKNDDCKQSLSCWILDIWMTCKHHRRLW